MCFFDKLIEQIPAQKRGLKQQKKKEKINRTGSLNQENRKAKKQVQRRNPKN